MINEFMENGRSVRVHNSKINKDLEKKKDSKGEMHGIVSNYKQHFGDEVTEHCRENRKNRERKWKKRS